VHSELTEEPIPVSGLLTVRDLGALHPLSASACACHQHIPMYN